MLTYIYNWIYGLSDIDKTNILVSIEDYDADSDDSDNDEYISSTYLSNNNINENVIKNGENLDILKEYTDYIISKIGL